MLHELDRELEGQGLRFVRYADDFSIYVKTKTSARKIGNSIFKFLKKKLKLTINRERADCKENVWWTFLRRSQLEGRAASADYLPVIFHLYNLALP